MNTLQQAIELVGDQNQMAEICGVTRQAVYKWVKAGRPPAHQCRTIEAATGALVTRYQLRPDIFGEPLNGKR